MADREDELAETLDDLARTLTDLQRELESRRRPRFRPPTPGELLRFSDEVAIPTLLAILEANLRALEGLQRGIRLLRAEGEARERTGRAAEATRSRADDLRRTTLSQLDAALVELQRAVGEGALPREGEARELIEEARNLREEVDRRLREAGGTTDGAATTRTIEIDGEPDGTDADDSDDPSSAVDVDAELETLRDRYAPDDGAGERDESATDGDGADAGADDESGTDTDESGTGADESGTGADDGPEAHEGDDDSSETGR